MASADNDFSNCVLKSDEVRRGETVKTVWCLKNVSSQSNLEAVIADSSCVVELGDGENKIRLSFFFEPEEVYYLTDHFFKSLTLCCAVLSGGEGKQLKFIVKLDMLQENLKLQSALMTERLVTIKSPGDRRRKVVGKKILAYLNARNQANGTIHSENYLYASCNDLRFGITVTGLVSTGEGELNRIGELGAVSSPEVILAQDLKDMFANHDNYSDLKLETKDGVETNTHKFILAARSPVLQAIIEKECAKESFKGVIKIPEFNAKPIIAVLHWMYTGRLSDRTGNVIEEVVIAAKKYQLTDMMRQLDKEMITICNTGNMFQLFEAARQNQLPIAMVQISAFIKENIETMVPHA